MNLLNCWARFDEAAGRLSIGNSRIEKTIRIQKSFLATEQVTDLRTGTVWSGYAPLWQRCPVLDAGESPKVRLTTEERTDVLGMLPHLKAVLELQGKNGTAWYEFLVFPEIPFVFTQLFAEKKGDLCAEAAQEEALSCTGIESQYVQSAQGDVFCGADTLDCIPLGSRHLEVESLNFFDKTDRNDFLLERQTSIPYKNGSFQREGNLFCINDYPHGDSLLLVKHSPTPSSALNRPDYDLVIQGNRYAALMGSGIDYAAMPGGRVPSYASAVGVGRTADIWEEFWRYSCAFSCGDPRKSLFIMSNTWGDRSQDMAVCESFLMEELRCAKDLGVDILQIDDGWESGITANSLRKSGGVWQGYYANDPDFWKVNPDRFPNGLEPIVEKAREYGLEVGLWFGPDSSQEFANVEKDIETIWGLYQRYGVRYFKLDGVKILSKRSEVRFIHMLEELTRRSGGDIRFNLDVTAEDRFGYLYQTQYGTLFVENRYTDFSNYYPHNTFKNLWSLSAVIPARRLQMELVNPRRNPERYGDLPFAPNLYSSDYLFAVVIPANPLVWMELSHLGKEDAALLSRITSVYKQYAAELFASRVIPIGDCPNGMRFSGYYYRNADGKSSHLLLFREETAGSAHVFRLPEAIQGRKPTVLYQSAPVEFSCSDQEVRADFSQVRSFLWLRLD